MDTAHVVLYTIMLNIALLFGRAYENAIENKDMEHYYFSYIILTFFAGLVEIGVYSVFNLFLGD